MWSPAHKAAPRVRFSAPGQFFIRGGYCHTQKYTLSFQIYANQEKEGNIQCKFIPEHLEQGQKIQVIFMSPFKIVKKSYLNICGMTMIKLEVSFK